MLILDSGTAGGQTVLTDKVANYPGVVETSGRELSQTMLQQARSFGCEVKPFARITEVDLAGEVKTVTLKNGDRVTARAVIIATGASRASWACPASRSSAAAASPTAPPATGPTSTARTIHVIGGGNSAVEESLFLTQFAKKVTIIHQFDHFQAEPWIVAEAQANEKISFLMNQRVLDFTGDSGLACVRSAGKEDDAVTETTVDGCFVFVGYVPNSGAFEGQIELTERGEIVTDDALRASLPGVFAAGDVRHKRVRQITTAVADGTVAALSALEYLGEAAS